MMRWTWLVALVVAGALAAACDDAPEDGEAGGGGGGGEMTSPCTVDDHSRADKAIALELGGAPATGEHLCPPQDEDWFRFELPAGQPLVEVSLAFPEGATSAVELSYELYRDGALDTAVGSGADTVTTDNRSSVRQNHYLDPAGGTYYVRVRDAGNEDQDPRNTYSVSVAAAADEDPNEPNQDCATATPLAATGTGRLSFQGDRDAFSFTVNGSQILDLHVTSPATPVDLKATLYDADGNFLTTLADPLGTDGNDVPILFGVRSDRPLCVVIEDEGGDEADPAVAYQLALGLTPEPDPNEQTSRNDAPATATQLPAGQAVQGAVASRGDVDWYELAVQPGQLVQVQVTCDSCTYELTLDLVHGDTGSPCETGDACDFLLAGACGADGSCDSGICRETPDGPRCGYACEEPIDCASFECQLSGNVAACTGGGVCVDGQCGVAQWSRIASPGASQSLGTAQPVRKAPLYARVRDYQDNQFGPGTYTITYSVSQDPDPNDAGGQLNNFYFPYNDRTELNQVLRAGRDRATSTPWTAVTDAGGAVLYREASGGGCIGFQGDVDVFRLEGGNPCTTGHCGLQLAFDEPAGSNLDLRYFLVDRGMSPRAGFQTSMQGGDRLFGDDPCNGTEPVECLVYDQDESDDYYLVVYDTDLDDWDLDGSHCYTFTITSAAAAGCPTSCPIPYQGNGACTCGG